MAKERNAITKFYERLIASEKKLAIRSASILDVVSSSSSNMDHQFEMIHSRFDELMIGANQVAEKLLHPSRATHKEEVAGQAQQVMEELEELEVLASQVMESITNAENVIDGIRDDITVSVRHLCNCT